MCITLHPQGEERRGCTGCIRPCIDISATDTYWHDQGKRGLQFAWTSYPGLVMGFFLLMLEQLHDRLDHVRSGLWAYRSDSLELPYTLLYNDSLLHLPRLVSLPALLVLSGCLSTGCFLVVQAHMARRLRRYLAAADARRLARHRTRLLATFTAVNVFFFFSDPSLGALWGAIGWAVRLLVGGGEPSLAAAALERSPSLGPPDQRCGWLHQRCRRQSRRSGTLSGDHLRHPACRPAAHFDDIHRQRCIIYRADCIDRLYLLRGPGWFHR
jgi:hypothetical protein